MGGTAEMLEVDRTVCRGEMQKAALTAHPTESVIVAYEQGQAQGDVFVGCMAQRGWILRPVQ